MRILTITVPSFERVARQIAGPDADVMTTGAIFSWPKKAIYDLVMVFAHPSADGRAWVDDEGRVVATAEEIAESPLSGAVVYLGVCWGMENEALIDALFEAGARAVVAGPGENYGGQDGVMAGSDVMAGALRAAMQVGLNLAAAWGLARVYVLTAQVFGVPGAADALEFDLIERDGGEGRSRWGCIAGAISLAMLMISILFGALNAPPMSLMPFRSPISNLPTWTPDYTPQGWLQQSQTLTVTATPCQFGCGPTQTLPGIAYYIWMPLVMSDYGWTWETLLYVNGAISATATITGGDAVIMADTVTASGPVLSYTLVEQWSASLAYSATSASIGSVITAADRITWTVNGLDDSATLQATYSVNTGTYTSDVITRVLILSTGAVSTRTEDITHE